MKKNMKQNIGGVSAWVVAFLFLFLLSSHMVTVVEPAATDCLDSCQTGCVQRDSRLTSRCEAKCSIRCAPPALAEDVGGD